MFVVECLLAPFVETSHVTYLTLTRMQFVHYGQLNVRLFFSVFFPVKFDIIIPLKVYISYLYQQIKHECGSFLHSTYCSIVYVVCNVNLISALTLACICCCLDTRKVCLALCCEIRYIPTMTIHTK